jgi:hypothetical protein
MGLGLLLKCNQIDIFFRNVLKYNTNDKHTNELIQSNFISYKFIAKFHSSLKS